jgi:hypothetical protein
MIVECLERSKAVTTTRSMAKTVIGPQMLTSMNSSSSEVAPSLSSMVEYWSGLVAESILRESFDTQFSSVSPGSSVAFGQVRLP